MTDLVPVPRELGPLDNPLFDVWQNFERSRRFAGHGWGDSRPNPNWDNPREVEVWSKELDARHTLRTECCKRYSWAIPDDEALSVLLTLGSLVEVGAGLGYWAALIRARGGEIWATDIGGEALENYHKDSGAWTEVSLGVRAEEAACLAGRDGQTLFLCWPPYDHGMAVTALRTYLLAGGRTVAYVGEGHGGCTANDEFHELLVERLVHERTVLLPQWDGMHDDLQIWRRE